MHEHELNKEVGTELPSWLAEWHHLVVHGLQQVPEVTLVIEQAMGRAHYPPRDCFSVRLAAEEALVNAVKHGHQGDEKKPVHVRLGVGVDKVLIEVEDQGPGFDPHGIPDPLAPENLDRTTGRGLFLINAYSTWVRWNRQGNRVTLCRRRSTGCLDSGVMLVGWDETSSEPASLLAAESMQGVMECPALETLR